MDPFSTQPWLLEGISSMNFNCMQHGGCGFVGHLINLVEHYIKGQCSCRLKRCPNKYCPVITSNTNHAKYCVYKLVHCANIQFGCNTTVLSRDIKSHQRNCVYSPILATIFSDKKRKQIVPTSDPLFEVQNLESFLAKKMRFNLNRIDEKGDELVEANGDPYEHSKRSKINQASNFHSNFMNSNSILHHNKLVV